MSNHFSVRKGQLTFDAEGCENRGPYFSRKPHVPGAYSGVTIGRGYDLSQRHPNDVVRDLSQCGIPKRTAEQLSKSCGSKGSHAKKAVDHHRLSTIEITPEQQKKLFEKAYGELEQDVKRICAKGDVVKAYGKTDWNNLSPAIAEVLVDLRYRGDYTPATRKKLQKRVARNDLDGFYACLSDAPYWQRQGVPSDRYKRRVQFIQQAMGKQQTHAFSKKSSPSVNSKGLVAKILRIRDFVTRLYKTGRALKRRFS